MTCHLQGFGLAAACAALQLRARGCPVRIFSAHPGASEVAAGLVNPFWGRHFAAHPQAHAHYEEAHQFYRQVEAESGLSFWHPLPIHRLFSGPADRAKFEKKRPLHEPWIAAVTPRGVRWTRGGWLDIPTFLQAARQLLTPASFLTTPPSTTPPHRTLLARGAWELRHGLLRHLPSRPAHGEILTLRLPDFPTDEILNSQGWLIPLQHDLFRAGSTYRWDDLDAGPSEAGQQKISAIVSRLTGRSDFEILDHCAGVRPILERSQPQIHFHPTHGWLLNGLGSHGSLLAPATTRQLTEKMLSSP